MDYGSSRKVMLLRTYHEGPAPFEIWYESLSDSTTRRLVLAAITRLADPNYRNFKSVGNGVQELRIFAGPGYRIYFGLQGSIMVILLIGGDKHSQKEDVNEAKKLWRKFKAEINRSLREFPY